VKRSIGLVLLLGLAILSLVAVVAVTRPVRVELPREPDSSDTTAARLSKDGGSLDSLLDAIQVDHLLKRGR
jgi:hypothetical protein